jgi:hypothetical protein
MRISFVGLNGPAPSCQTPSRPAAKRHRAQPPDAIAPRRLRPAAIAPRSRQPPEPGTPPAPSSLLPLPSTYRLRPGSAMRHCSRSRAPGAIARCSRSRFPDSRCRRQPGSAIPSAAPYPVPTQCSAIPSPSAVLHTQCSAIPSPSAAPYPVSQWPVQ